MNEPQDCIADESEYDDDECHRDDADSEAEQVVVTVMERRAILGLRDLQKIVHQHST